MPKQPLAVSLSAVSAFRECQQLYYYRYIERLKRKDKPLAPELGIMLHDYLSIYYQGLKTYQDQPFIPDKALIAHKEALPIFKAKYQAECSKMAKALLRVDQKKLALEIAKLPEKAERIAERYFLAHGKEDEEAFEIILVEEALRLPLFQGRAISNGRLDLIARERQHGIVLLWEHKSGLEIPQMNHRLRDLQTPLYRRKIEKMKLAPHIDAVLWNYLRTKEPAIPKLLKPKRKGEAPGLTRKKSLDSTWEVYLAEIERHGLDPADYEDVKARLDGRELSVFFPRFNQPILTEFDILYRDYLETTKEIAIARQDWRHGRRAPVRSLGVRCNWCEMNTLCMSAILSGSDEDVKLLRFTKPT